MRTILKAHQNISKKLSFSLIFLFCLYFFNSMALAKKESSPRDLVQEKSAPDQVTTGKSIDLSSSFLKEDEKPYSYKPIDEEFWTKIQAFIREGNSISVIIEAAKKETSTGFESMEGGEATLALALGLRERKLYYGAFYSLLRVAKNWIGSALGEAALFELSRIVQENVYDETSLNQLLIANEFSSLHPDVASFVSYYKAIDLLQFGFKEWAQVEKNRIKKGSYWDHLFRYWTAIGEVSRDRIDNAIILLQKLMEEPTLHPHIFQKVALQYARLVFEQGDFQTALAIYNNLGLTGVREIGRVQLERAWVHYYLKDYSKAMGILTALKSPYFESSLTFERYILEMIIYRELCHYQAVEYVAKDFRKIFSASLSSIRQRKPLRENRLLFNLSVINREVQDTANLIDQVRREKESIQEYNWKEFTFFKPLLEEYERIDKTIQSKIDRQLEEKARMAANELLDAEEQISFLEYTSRLDQLRIYRSGESNYKAKEISYVTFEKIYWPVDGEFWWDEMPDYKMNISSLCGDNSTPDETKMEKDFR